MPNSEVLLVEDNDINRDMLTRRLSRAGLTVITAQDGETALETMRTAQPGVVLMDMTLPVLDGWEGLIIHLPLRFHLRQNYLIAPVFDHPLPLANLESYGFEFHQTHTK